MTRLQPVTADLLIKLIACYWREWTNSVGPGRHASGSLCAHAVSRSETNDAASGVARQIASRAVDRREWHIERSRAAVKEERGRDAKYQRQADVRVYEERERERERGERSMNANTVRILL